MFLWRPSISLVPFSLGRIFSFHPCFSLDKRGALARDRGREERVEMGGRGKANSISILRNSHQMKIQCPPSISFYFLPLSLSSPDLFLLPPPNFSSSLRRGRSSSSRAARGNLSTSSEKLWAVRLASLPPFSAGLSTRGICHVHLPFSSFPSTSHSSKEVKRRGDEMWGGGGRCKTALWGPRAISFDRHRP